MTKLRSIFFLILFVTKLAQAEGIEEFLQTFHAHPAATMEQLPPFVAKGKAIPRGKISYKKIAPVLQERNFTRIQIMGKRKETQSIGFQNATDQAERLIEPSQAVVKNIAEMENRALLGSTLKETPWADSYWPTYMGLLGNRYADPAFPKAKVWGTNYDYIQSRPAVSILQSGDAAAIDALSPAEKYDIAMGDTYFTLTRFSWQQGEKYLRAHDGRLPLWMGICHGWSAASTMAAPIPQNPITVLSPSSIPITFYPQDVKALQSMLWANASPSTRFIGSRCDILKPAKNRNGRILENKCFDANPGTWHISIVNQMGLQHRTFIMDGTYDIEVWNFPILSFQYRYFNPQTLQEANTVHLATIPKENYSIDKFKEFRSLDAKYIVGIYMDVTYLVETNPIRGPVVDPTKTVRFIYDLELDGDKNIIGGEWYSNAHPDFLWTYNKTAQAMARGDAELISEPWTTDSSIPSRWTSFAQAASAQGQPLFSFIRKIAGGGN